MIRTLLIIAGAGLVLSIACLSGAAALGGRDFVRAVENGESWGWAYDEDSHGNARNFRRIENGPRVTKTLEWAGGESLTVDLSADVIYIQDATPSVTVTGRQGDVDRVRIVGDRLTMEDGEEARIGFQMDDGLTITVAGPAVKRFRISGSGDLELRRYEQDTLDLAMTGSGDVEATGRTRALDLDMSGSGEAWLEPLVVADAKVGMSGSGDADLSATGTVAIDLSGSGDISLHRRPASLATSDTGSGDVHEEY